MLEKSIAFLYNNEAYSLSVVCKNILCRIFVFLCKKQYAACGNIIKDMPTHSLRSPSEAVIEIRTEVK